MVGTIASRLNHYEVLGIKPTASGEEIARAFARESSVFRPHAFGVLTEVCLAYETLRDPIKRRTYDASLGLKPEPKPWSLSTGPRSGSATHSAVAAGPVERPAFRLDGNDPAPAAVAIPELSPPEPEPRISRGDAPRPGWEEELGAEVRPVDWRRAGKAFGGIIVTACVLGGLAGWWSASAIGETPQPENSVSLSLPPAQPRATPEAPNTAPVPSLPEAGPDRPEPAIARAEVIRRTPVAPVPAAAEEQVPETAPEIQPDSSSPAQAADEAATILPVAAAMPLPNRVIARTIDRIGYPCGRVVSTTATEGEAAGAYKVTCSSGQSYQARPVNGRYHFRRWGRR